MPGLAGKGTIVIALGVETLDLGETDFRRMEALGYSYGGTHDLPQHIFRRGERFPREFLVYVVIHDRQIWRDHLTFRDHLCDCPEDAEAYAALKADLLAGREECYSGRDKAPFIEPILSANRDSTSTRSARGA